MSKTIRCTRCNRRYRNQSDWNTTYKAGRIVGYLCPKCQTPEEHLEAAINEATVDYSNTTTIPGVTEEMLATTIPEPYTAEDFNLTGWAAYINRGLVAVHAQGADLMNPDIFAMHINRLGNESISDFHITR